MLLNNKSTASTQRNNLLCVSGQAHDRDFAFSERAVISRPQNSLSPVVAKFTFPLITYVSTIDNCLH